MEKLKIGTQEFNLAPMGIVVNQGKTRSFKFITELAYADVYALVSLLDNFATIEIIGEDGNTQNTYADCVSLKGLGFDLNVRIDDSTVADVYTVTYSTDAVQKELNSLKEQITTANLTISDIDSQCDDLVNTIVMISMM